MTLKLRKHCIQHSINEKLRQFKKRYFTRKFEIKKTLEIILISHVLFCCGYYIEQAHINNKRIRIILIFHSNNYYNNKLPLSDEISILFVVFSVRSNHCKYIYRTIWYSLSWSWYPLKTNKTKYILHHGRTMFYAHFENLLFLNS